MYHPDVPSAEEKSNPFQAFQITLVGRMAHDNTQVFQLSDTSGMLVPDGSLKFHAHTNLHSHSEAIPNSCQIHDIEPLSQKFAV
jgi:hypothetical protein